jgi:hypothetical protein
VSFGSPLSRTRRRGNRRGVGRIAGRTTRDGGRARGGYRAREGEGGGISRARTCALWVKFRTATCRPTCGRPTCW